MCLSLFSIWYDFANIERVEVLKGPASVLFGQGLPGGTINQITKQPLRDPFYGVDATIGSYDFYRGAIDLSGPLNSSQTALYRLNAAYKNSGSFVDFVENRQLLIAPVLSLAVGEKTRLTLEGEYIGVANDATAFGIPAIGTVLPNQNGKIPRDRNFNEPSAFYDEDIGKVGYRLEHQFSDNWSLRNVFRAAFYRNEQEFFNYTSLASDQRTLNRVGFLDRRNNADYYDATVDLVGKFLTGSVEHQLLIGTALSLDRSTDRFFRGAATPIDLFNPVFSRRLGPLSRFSTASKTDVFGVYIQDQIKLAENLKLLLGGRFDTFKQTTENRVANTEQEQSGNAFSPRVGIVYQPIPPISLYASYSRSFSPVTGTTFSGDSFVPERGTQYEVGVKADLSNRLSTTLSLFDTIRSNVTTADPINAGFSIQTGEQRSRGIELSLAGEILPGWNIFAGYSYNDVRITKDNTFAVDNRVNNAPENSFNLWTTYEFQRGLLQGFGFGGGLFFVGERQGNLNNTFTVPSYLRTDAAIFYKRGQFRAQVNFRNLFNIDYFESAVGDLRLYPGEPFTVQGTISWQF
ncbi:TonB-dependent siderophore receptor [Myxacorys almedinensis]|uniref:TonB-dependent siderophore receptor n=1 Tax=Myxacorys almedinensis TaxID=2651157 RepID=UPI003083BD8E